jgi:hypothetical protein
LSVNQRLCYTAAGIGIAPSDFTLDTKEFFGEFPVWFRDLLIGSG